MTPQFEVTDLFQASAKLKLVIKLQLNSLGKPNSMASGAVYQQPSKTGCQKHEQAEEAGSALVKWVLSCLKRIILSSITPLIPPWCHVIMLSLLLSRITNKSKHNESNASRKSLLKCVTIRAFWKVPPYRAD